jgi:hypothetical protein
MRIKIGTMGAKVSWHIHYATPCSGMEALSALGTQCITVARSLAFLCDVFVSLLKARALHSAPGG